MLLKRIFQLVLIVLLPGLLAAQVTSSSITGTVLGDNNKPIEAVQVIATHGPSGTRYSATTDKEGHYSMPNVRVGGPYQVVFTYSGLTTYEVKDIYANLGTTSNVDANMATQKTNNLGEVIVSARSSSLISSKKTGASTVLGLENINRTPTIGRTINDITKYNAYGNGSSFGGQDPRLNNITIDGSVFNNGYGLGSSAIAGGRTGSTAISLDALEQIQINIAPFDIRQSGFAGAGINAVTRSGTNDFNGSAYYMWNNRGLTGKKAASDTTNIAQTPFSNKTYGFRLGGPIIKNKLFFFVNGEFVRSTQPALSFVANGSGSNGNPSRTTSTDLNDLKSFLSTNFGYNLGAIDNFNLTSKSDKILARFDYNINDYHKLTFRYSFHNSRADQLISNSSSSNTAGNGNRQNLQTAISGQNTGYVINDNTRSYVLELNSNLKNGLSNQFLATLNKQIEDRGAASNFPTVDILKDGNTYTSIGMDPFTPNNRLNYSTFNVTNNLTYTKNKHTMTFGASYERFKSNNLFFYASNGVWTFNSISDFEAAATAYKNNPNITVSPVPIARFNYRYTLLPNGQLPWQVFKTNTISAYMQDEYKVASNFRLTGGVRFDYVSVPNTAKDYYNRVVDSLNFYNPSTNDSAYKVNTALMPKSRMYISPRIGFNWDVKGDRKTQIRGGTGIFLSRIPYVLLSNQLGNNGVNIGLVNVTSAQNASANYPFTLDPSKYTPATTDVTKLKGYNVNASDRNFKFPQVWKSDIAIDQALPWGGLVATVEAIYNKSIHAMYYFDANMKNDSANFAGDDNRGVYPSSKYINSQIGGVYMLTNTNKGYSYSFTGKIEKPLTRAWGGMIGYTYSKAKDLYAAGLSTVNVNTPSVEGVNYVGMGYSDNDLRHRFVGTASYRLVYGGDFGGATTFTLGVVSASGAKVSYIASNDINGDGQYNDPIYIPKKGSSLNFVDLKSDKFSATAAQEQAAFDAFVDNNKYLSSKRGQYAERNGASYPWLTRMDLSIEQDVYIKVGKDGKRNTLRFRADILNFGNMLNNKWGVGNSLTTATPLVYKGKNASGQPTYNLATQVINGQTQLLRDSFIKSRTINDVYQIQLGVRYIFGN